MTPTPNAPSLAGVFSPSLPQFVGVLGGGRMGAGIAHAFLLAGCDVHGDDIGNEFRFDPVTHDTQTRPCGSTRGTDSSIHG